MLVVSVLVNWRQKHQIPGHLQPHRVFKALWVTRNPVTKQETNLISLAAHTGNPRVKRQRRGTTASSASLLHIVEFKVSEK